MTAKMIEGLVQAPAVDVAHMWLVLLIVCFVALLPYLGESLLEAIEEFRDANSESFEQFRL